VYMMGDNQRRNGFGRRRRGAGGDRSIGRVGGAKLGLRKAFLEISS
jgi:hypothetical protein